jgi:hypothetical protein
MTPPVANELVDSMMSCVVSAVGGSGLSAQMSGMLLRLADHAASAHPMG